eukprot:gnl/Chilomastix_caulleri/3804.p1 GENE.gnl/Chilomastix_caulleri/3804~~gnl/Chilomastix_caulleri/3804.p1  ORF type:complete len:96 (+),score=7.01 gnl/Chilomastix_caulleri/3804:81-368(+)
MPEHIRVHVRLRYVDGTSDELSHFKIPLTSTFLDAFKYLTGDKYMRPHITIHVTTKDKLRIHAIVHPDQVIGALYNTKEEYEILKLTFRQQDQQH